MRVTVFGFLLCVSLHLARAEDPSMFTTSLKPTRPASNLYLLRFMSAPFDLVHSTSHIDAAVMRVVRRGLGGDRMAEPGERVQVSDVVEPGHLPSHRLILAGHTADMWFVVYFEGGYSPMNKLVLLSRAPGTWRVAFYGDLPMRVTTLDQIRAAIRKGGLYVNPTDHRYEKV
jgi:hypothetical protein